MFKTIIATDDQFISGAQLELIQSKIDQMVNDNKTDGGLEAVPGPMSNKTTYIRRFTSREYAQEFIDFLAANFDVIGPQESINIEEE